MGNIFHITHCIVCSGTDFSKKISAKDWLVSKEPFDILQCNACGFRFTQDAPDVEHIAPYYNTENYIEHSDTKRGLTFSLYHYGRKIMLKHKLRLINKLATSKTKKLLDVGSGSGYFLNFMKNNGYDCTGIEISKTARELTKKTFDIDTHDVNSLINNDLKEKFDVITMWHVFEHVYTFDAYFEAFKSSLNESGKLIIAMPNYHCLEAKYYKAYWNGYDVPRHLWHFDFETFSSFANKRGFKITEYHILPLDPFYNAMVSAEYKPHFTFLPFTLSIGFFSWLQSIFNKKRASSLVYVLSPK